jgi:hypothetical protein
MTRAIGMAALVAGLLAAAAGSALAQDAIKAPASKSIGGAKSHQMVPSLAVLNARGATLGGGKLTLTGVGSNTIVFADRPVRAAGHVSTLEFVDEWSVGKDSFAKDPPNATISVFGTDGKSVEDAVVVLKSPKLEGDQLTFDVDVLEGSIATAKGSAALFIDWFAVHGGGWGRGWHGAWYGHPGFVGGVAAGAVAGAAVGAAAAAPYYRPYPYPYYAPPACGYYAYPPC